MTQHESDGSRLGQRLTPDGGRVRIEAYGRPRTKGSLRPNHVKLAPGRCKVSLTEDGQYSTPWKNAMIHAIRQQCAIERYAGPVVVDCFFRFERLASQERRGDVWPVTQSGPTAHGDEDKLRRNVLDALTQAGLILDDSLVVGTDGNFKRFCRDGEGAGVLIKVRPATPEDLERILAMERQP